MGQGAKTSLGAVATVAAVGSDTGRARGLLWSHDRHCTEGAQGEHGRSKP